MCVAAIVVSCWEGEVDSAKLHNAMVHPVGLGEALGYEAV